MKKRKETPRPWPIRALLWIVGDPWRKLLAIALAIALYVQIDRDISDTQILNLRLTGALGEVEATSGESHLRLTVPGNYVILEAGAGPVRTDLVEVALSGPMRSLPKTRGFQQVNWTYPIETANLDLSDGQTELTLQLRDVIRSAGSIRDLEIGANYDLLHVKVGTTEERTIKLLPEHIGEPSAYPPSGYKWKRDQVEFSPSEIKISGPTTHLSRLELIIAEHGSLFSPVNLGDLRRNDTRQLDFADWLQDYGLKIDRTYVDARLVVEDEFWRFEVPISADDINAIINPPTAADVELEDTSTQILKIEVPRVLADRLEIGPSSSPEKLRQQLLRQYFVYVDASTLENVSDDRLRVRLDFREPIERSDLQAPEFIDAYRRVHLADDSLLWQAVVRRDKGD